MIRHIRGHSNMQLQNFKTFCASILLSKDKCYIVFECKQCFDFYNQMLFCTRSAMILMLLTNKTFYEYCHFCEQMIKSECLFSRGILSLNAVLLFSGHDVFYCMMCKSPISWIGRLSAKQ